MELHGIVELQQFDVQAPRPIHVGFAESAPISSAIQPETLAFPRALQYLLPGRRERLPVEVEPDCSAIVRVAE
ncbi:hypothetical protein NL676_026409 [Syzygium grande]|nr:hypothetical protein NL676_026409 [Syzygium grande]